MVKESYSSHCFFTHNMVSLVLFFWLTLSMKYTWTLTHRNTHAVHNFICLNGTKSLALGGDQVKGKLLQIGQH